MAFGKLAIVIGAGIIGSVLTKDGNLSDITYLVSGAFRIVTKHLQQEKNNSPSASKPQTDLLAQVNSLRQELQQLKPPRPVTIVREDTELLHSTIIVVDAAGLVIWWKGFRFSLAWWAYTSLMMGASNATIRYLVEVTNLFTRILITVLFAISTIIVAALLALRCSQEPALLRTNVGS